MIHELKSNVEILKIFSMEQYSYIMQDLAKTISEYQKTKPAKQGDQGRYAARQIIKMDDKTFRYMWIEAIWKKVNDTSLIIGLSNMIVADKEEELLNDEVLDRYNEIKEEMEEQTKNSF